MTQLNSLICVFVNFVILCKPTFILHLRSPLRGTGVPKRVTHSALEARLNPQIAFFVTLYINTLYALLYFVYRVCILCVQNYAASIRYNIILVNSKSAIHTRYLPLERRGSFYLTQANTDTHTIFANVLFLTH